MVSSGISSMKHLRSVSAMWKYKGDTNAGNHTINNQKPKGNPCTKLLNPVKPVIFGQGQPRSLKQIESNPGQEWLRITGKSGTSRTHDRQESAQTLGIQGQKFTRKAAGNSRSREGWPIVLENVWWMAKDGFSEDVKNEEWWSWVLKTDIYMAFLVRVKG